MQKQSTSRLNMLMFVLAIVLLVAAASACSSGEADDAETEEDAAEADSLAMEDYGVGDTFKAKDKVTFSMMYLDNPIYPVDENWMLFEEIEKRTNVSLDLTVVPQSDYSEKRSLLISSGDAPYIIPKTYPGEETPFAASGAILPVSDYIDYMPHFKDKAEKWDMGPFLETLEQEDGKFYVLPGMHENVWPDYTLAMRIDILEELGLEEPETWDELEVVLEEMKKAYPDVIPFSDRWEMKSTLNIAAPTFGTVAGWGIGSGLKYDEASDAFVFAPATEEYKSMVEYFRRLVDKGLLDPESVTQDDDQAIQKFVNGKSFVINTNSQTINLYRDDMDQILGEDNYEIRKITVPGGPKGHLIGGSKLENGIAISAKAKDDPHFITMLQFIDWLWYSDEGQEFTKWGVEGVTYTKESDGTRVLMDDIDYNGLNPSGSKDLRLDYGFSNGVFSYGGTTELLHSMMLEEELQFQEDMLTTKELVMPNPPIKYSQTELERANLLSTPLIDTAETATLEFIIGARDMSDWDAYVEELKSKGMDEYVELANEVYQKNKD